jgi:hypothetical protein
MSSKTKMVGAGHHVRAKTNIPIIGILTQPILEGKMTDQYHKIKKEVEESHNSNDHSEEFKSAQYIEVTHVKFLESAGARVVPIDYTLTAEELKKRLKEVNGLYIPGDSETLVHHGNLEFTNSVKTILLWAQTHNEENNSHFPILGVSYGFLSMIRS